MLQARANRDDFRPEIRDEKKFLPVPPPDQTTGASAKALAPKQAEEKLKSPRKDWTEPRHSRPRSIHDGYRFQRFFDSAPHPLLRLPQKHGERKMPTKIASQRASDTKAGTHTNSRPSLVVSFGAISRGRKSSVAKKAR